MKFEDYAGNKIETQGCPGCDFANHKCSLPCGLIFENDILTISQDWELPICGFIVIAPKKHVEYLSEFSDEERNQIFFYVNKTLKYLKELRVCEEFNVIFEEKKGCHFHVWLMPRHSWIQEKFGNPIKHIKEIFEYALKELKNKSNITEVENVVKKLKDCFEK